jgi:hypothetical protein
MGDFSGQFLNFRIYKPLTLLFLVFLQISCKTPQQKLEGQWEIVEFKDHKQYLLPILKKYYLNGTYHFQFPQYPDPPSKDGAFTSVRDDLKDSLIWFQLDMYYDKPIIKFSTPFYYGISDRKNSLYFSLYDSTGYKDQIPVNLFDGKWKLNREGENELELTRTGSDKIYMVFRRKY